jgi:hypothetical protein
MFYNKHKTGFGAVSPTILARVFAADITAGAAF